MYYQIYFIDKVNKIGISLLRYLFCPFTFYLQRICQINIFFYMLINCLFFLPNLEVNQALTILFRYTIPVQNPL